MAHNTLVRSGGWLSGSTVLTTELHQLDQNLASAVNGDDGSTHAPTSAISIGGSGVVPSVPVVLLRGGTLTTGTSSGIALNDTDFPVLLPGHAGRTRKVMHPCARARGAQRYVWRVRREDGGLQAYAPMFDDSSGVGPQVARCYVPIRAHDGSTLGKITVYFRVIVPHAGLPSTMPSFRVLRLGADGTTVPLTSQASGADPNGYVYIPAPSGGPAWTNGGQTQSFVIQCDQNNVVSVASYDYLLEIVEEQWPAGTAYPFLLVYKTACRVASVGANINLATGTLITLDGITLNQGDRVLVKDQTDPTYNGTYTAHSGTWTRTVDQFAPGTVVPVMSGAQNQASYWQVPSTASSWQQGTGQPFTAPWAASTSFGANEGVTPVVTNGLWFKNLGAAGNTGASEPAWPTSPGQTVVDNAVTWTCMGPWSSALSFVSKADVANPAEGSSLFPHGIVWQAALVEFDNIVDGRWQ